MPAIMDTMHMPIMALAMKLTTVAVSRHFSEIILADHHGRLPVADLLCHHVRDVVKHLADDRDSAITIVEDGRAMACRTP